MPEIKEFHRISRTIGIALIAIFVCVFGYFLLFGGRGVSPIIVLVILTLTSTGGFFATVAAIYAWRGEVSARRLLPVVLICDVILFLAMAYEFFLE